uniref:Uncharacterized protein n=1 Tax=Arundo donax TaxID=35708 RepID=A0A0A9AAP9_ARUDO
MKKPARASPLPSGSLPAPWWLQLGDKTVGVGLR